VRANRFADNVGGAAVRMGVATVVAWLRRLHASMMHVEAGRLEALRLEAGRLEAVRGPEASPAAVRGDGVRVVRALGVRSIHAALGVTDCCRRAGHRIDGDTLSFFLFFDQVVLAEARGPVY